MVQVFVQSKLEINKVVFKFYGHMKQVQLLNEAPKPETNYMQKMIPWSIIGKQMFVPIPRCRLFNCSVEYKKLNGARKKWLVQI